MVSRWTGCLPEKAGSQLAKSRESPHSWGAIDLPSTVVQRFILIRRPLLTGGTERNPVEMACALPEGLADSPAHCAAAPCAALSDAGCNVWVRWINTEPERFGSSS